MTVNNIFQKEQFGGKCFINKSALLIKLVFYYLTAFCMQAMLNRTYLNCQVLVYKKFVKKT